MSAQDSSSQAEAAQPTSQVHPFPKARVKQKTPKTPSEPTPEAAPAPEAPVSVEVPAAPPATPRKRSAGRFLLPLFGLALLGAAGWYGHQYWTDGRFLVSTDDAYVEADMAFVSPKVGGYIGDRKVQENQAVKAGDPLFIIEDGDYRIALAQTEAQIETQKRSLDTINAQIVAGHATLGQAQAQKASTEATAANADRAAERAQRLLATKVGTQAQLDDANTAREQAKAAMAAADAQIATAQANIGVLEAQLKQAESALASLELARQKADRDLGFTILRAPYDGVVGNIAAEKGDLVSSGQRLAAVIPVDRLHIVANFKETQIGRIVPGEKVRVAVDALPEGSFEGTVSSLAPASGAVYSMLPPENATGNFTKVVQRVPIRIDVPAAILAEGKLRAGLSVVVDVDIRTAPNGQSIN